MDKREILFRAWNKTNKYMDEDFSIHADGCIYQSSKRTWDIADLAVETAYDDFEIMQFTGLTDKNGANIFEGDIIKIALLKDYGFAGKFTDYHKAVISFENGCFWFTTIPEIDYQQKTTDCNWHFYDARDRVVIGNIYEHPELLK